MAKKLERRKRVYADTNRRLNEHSSGDSLATKLPEGIERFKPKDSDYDIAIIPFQMSKTSKRFLKTYAKPGEDHWEQTYWVHYNVGPNESAVCCPAKNFGKPCPICEHHAKMRQDPKVTDKELSAFKAKERQFFLIFDLADPRKGLQLWEIANFNFGKQLDTKLRKASEKNAVRYRNFWHVDDGLNLRIVGTEETTGKGGKPFTKFTVDEFNDREEELPVEITEHDICLDELPQELSYEKLKKLFAYGSEEETEEEEEKEEEAEEKDEVEEEEEEPEEEEEKEEETEETEEEEEEEEVEFAKGDTVMYRYKGKRYVGTIIKIKDEVATVEVDGEKRPSMVDFSDLTKLEQDEEEETEKEEEEEAEGDDDWGDEDDAPVNNGKPPAGKKPAPKKPTGKR